MAKSKLVASTEPSDNVAELVGIGSRLLKSDEKHQERLAENLSDIFRIAETFRDDSAAWKECCDAPQWVGFRGRPTQADQMNCLKFAVRLAVGLEGSSARSQSSRYHRAMRIPFAEGKRHADIKKAILKDGLTALIKADSGRTAVIKATSPLLKAVIQPLDRNCSAIIGNLKDGETVKAILKRTGQGKGSVQFTCLKLKPKVVAAKT